ncbi:MAG: peptidase [Bacteroidetes bacterium]|nr:MAG: peptidase [Bacteroidota bacterium]
MKLTNFFIAGCLFIAACSNPEKQQQKANLKLQEEVQQYLNDYNQKYQLLVKMSSEAEWRLNTKIVPGDTLSAQAAQAANKKLADFTGSKTNIETAKKYLTQKNALTPLQVKQLEAILYKAGGSPETAGNVIIERIKAETEQTEKLFGFDYQLDGKSVTTNEIDEKLRSETNLSERQKVWECSKEVGKELKDGLEKLRDLRNKSVQALGYHDFFEYQVSEYGLSTEEMSNLLQQMIRDIWPLYRELHTWARYELAKKYNAEVPDYLPAHWLPNRWGQDWSAMVQVEGVNLDEALEYRGREWIIQTGEEFYKSLGFSELPKTFWERSSLYPLPPHVKYKKNNHASAWHIDLDKDVRSLMSIEPNTEWWETALHELGHIYYFLEYSNPDVPIVLREGANRGFHEAMGSLMGLAAMQKPFLEELGLLMTDTQTDEMQMMLKEALNYVVLIPWGAGVMTEFEKSLYAENLPKDEFNKKWWELKKKYQGIVPPSERGEEFCDAASKTHINNDPAQYYDYAISNILLFQFHDYIAKNILHQNPHATNYYNEPKIGDFLKNIMKVGATKHWQQVLEENLGTGMSAKPMLEYFEPLLKHLKEVNKGRKYTLPETI